MEVKSPIAYDKNRGEFLDADGREIHPVVIVAACNHLHEVQTQLADAQAEIKRLRDALGHYADESQWYGQGQEMGDIYRAGSKAKGYELAQQALEQENQQEEGK